RSVVLRRGQAMRGDAVLRLPPSTQGAYQGSTHFQYLRAADAPERRARDLQLIVQALQNQPITVYGEGTQTRSCCYVDELIDGLIRSRSSGDDFVGPVNLAHPTEFTIPEAAQK